MAKSNPSNAVVDLLTELENCEVPNKWQQFVQVLRKCGYVYIVDNLRGYTFVGFEYQVQYIKTLAPSICPRIIPRELLPHLLAKELIKEQDKEEIQREELNFGSISASIMILDRIVRKQTYWYKLFVEALRNAGMDDIAGDLDIPELMVDKRCKVMKDRKHEDRQNIHDSRKEKKSRVINRSDNKSFLPTVPSRAPIQKNVACKDNDSGNVCERLPQDECDCEIYIQREEATPTCNQPHNLNKGIDEEYTDENFNTQNLKEFDHDIRLGDVLPASDQPNIKDTKKQLNPKMPEISENGLRLGEVSPKSEHPKVDDSDKQPTHSTPGSFEHGNQLAINKQREIRELVKQRNELRNKNMFYTAKATLKKEIALEALKLEQFLAAEEMNETKDLPILIATDIGNKSQKERCDVTESNDQNRLLPHNHESFSGKYNLRQPARKPSLNAVTPSQCELDQSKGALLQERDSTFDIMMQILLNDS